jgi:hypothetical protein
VKKKIGISFEMKNGKIISNRIPLKENSIQEILEQISHPQCRFFTMIDETDGTLCVINLEDVSFILLKAEESEDPSKKKED